MLEQVLPRRSSPNQIACADLALGYLAGIFPGAPSWPIVPSCGSTHCCRRCWGVKRLGSQSSYSRFLGSLTRPG